MKERTTAIFFYSGTYNASAVIDQEIIATKNEFHITTKAIKNLSKAHRYKVVRQGKAWKIASVEASVGMGKWLPNQL